MSVTMFIPTSSDSMQERQMYMEICAETLLVVMNNIKNMQNVYQQLENEDWNDAVKKFEQLLKKLAYLSVATLLENNKL